MTLDEAIKHCFKVAEESEYSAIMFKQKKEASAFLEKAEAEKAENDCKQRAADYRRLAEWLTELKEAKRILKAAMEDMKMLYEAGKDEGCVGIEFKWRYADEALKLIGGSENG